ncbi:SMP-30/gluconolactonase/LRE family protein (plasmid) [Methylobacterium oryzae CBMB20]
MLTPLQGPLRSSTGTNGIGHSRSPHDIPILRQVCCRLGEGSSYDPRTRTAWWVDILESRLFERPIADSQKALVDALHAQVSGIAAIGGAHQLLAAEDGLYARSIRDGNIRLLCLLEEDLPGNRSSDGRVHPTGGCGAARWVAPPPWAHRPVGA